MLGEFDEQGGYDCMTSGIQCGPANLDGYTYGEEYRTPLPDAAKKQMMADARLIAAAPDLLEMLFSLAGQAELVAGLPTCGEREVLNGIARQARAAIAKATGADK